MKAKKEDEGGHKRKEWRKIDGEESALRRVQVAREDNWSGDKSRSVKKRNVRRRRSRFSFFPDQLIFGHVASEKRYD